MKVDLCPFLSLQTAFEHRTIFRSILFRPSHWTEKMEKILKAGQVASTAVNFQPQKVYILKRKEALNKIHSLTRFVYNAPVRYCGYPHYSGKLLWGRLCGFSYHEERRKRLEDHGEDFY